MKKIKCPLLMKSVLLIALALCTLLVGTVHVFAASSGEKDITEDSFVPGGANIPSGTTLTILDKVVLKAINDGTTPPEASDYSDKYDVYNHVSTENGKSVITVYSAEQIATLATSTNVLANDEALYLLDNTVKLFLSYDIVRIVDKNGETKSYKGASFYSSDAYYDSFGLITEANEDDSYNLKEDVFNAMLTRLEVLASASVRFSISGHGNEGAIFLGREPADAFLLEADVHAIDHYYSNSENFVLPEEVEDDEIYWCEHCESYEWEFYDDRLNNNYGSWLNCRDAQVGKEYGVLLFEQGNIFYIEDLSAADYHDIVKLYPDLLFDSTIGDIKYDRNNEKVAIIEVWDTASETVVARLRLDNVNNSDEIAQLEALWLGVKESSAPVEDYFTVTDYRVAVYLNGFESSRGTDAFRYNADGNLDQWAFQNGTDTFEPLFLTGTAEIAAYVNGILEEALQK